MANIVYMLRCADGSFYTGMTVDLTRRLTEHELGLDEMSYTYSRRPVQLVWSQEFPTHDEAFACEHQVKGWSRAKKEALINGHWDMIHQIVKDERKAREKAKHIKNRKAS